MKTTESSSGSLRTFAHRWNALNASCSSADNSTKNSRFGLHPIAFGLMLGLALGLATKNIGVGIAVGVVFATINGGFSRGAK